MVLETGLLASIPAEVGTGLETELVTCTSVLGTELLWSYPQLQEVEEEVGLVNSICQQSPGLSGVNYHHLPTELLPRGGHPDSGLPHPRRVPPVPSLFHPSVLQAVGVVGVHCPEHDLEV